jgi:hypothetical protein
MFTFRMIKPDGSPADPPTFTSAVPNWDVGDEAMVRPDHRFRIVAVAYDEENDIGVWTVEPV